MAVLSALVVVPALAYVATVLVPYYASGLDELSLAELSDGSPEPSGPGRFLGVLGFFSLLLTPLGALLSLGGCVLLLLAAFPRVEHRLSSGVAAGLFLVAAGGLAVLVFFLSPLGRALTTWQMD